MPIIGYTRLPACGSLSDQVEHATLARTRAERDFEQLTTESKAVMLGRGIASHHSEAMLLSLRITAAGKPMPCRLCTRGLRRTDAEVAEPGVLHRVLRGDALRGIPREHGLDEVPAFRGHRLPDAVVQGDVALDDRLHDLRGVTGKTCSVLHGYVGCGGRLVRPLQR